MSKVKIANWAIFATHSVAIEIHAMSVDDKNNLIYQSALGVFLNDGKSTFDDYKKLDPLSQKHITILNDLYDTDVDRLIMKTAAAVSGMFENLNTKAYIFDDHESTPREVNLEKMVSDLGVESTDSVSIH